VTLHSLAREILKPYIAMDDGRISIGGADVAVDDAAATPFALILHELATNAKKYGALSTEAGKVDITSSCDGEECRLIWTETGGPGIAAAPAATGFGTKLMLASAQSHLNGKIGWAWNAEGLGVTVTCPRSSLLRAAYAPHTSGA
jgi:two-component sensor histidine kinase